VSFNSEAYVIVLPCKPNMSAIVKQAYLGDWPLGIHLKDRFIQSFPWKYRYHDAGV